MKSRTADCLACVSLHRECRKQEISAIARTNAVGYSRFTGGNDQATLPSSIEYRNTTDTRFTSGALSTHVRQRDANHVQGPAARLSQRATGFSCPPGWTLRSIRQERNVSWSGEEGRFYCES